MSLDIGEWGRVLGLLKDEVGETAYRSWLHGLRVERVDHGEAVVAAPTRFLRNWVATHYADRLLSLWRIENPAIARLSLVVDPEVAAPRDGAPVADPAEPPGRRGLRQPEPHRAVQSPVPLWRGRPRQDAPDARDRLARQDARARPQGDLPVGREVHVPVHSGVALQVDNGLQGAVPLGRFIDDRRCSIHRRQGFDPGRILPHL